MTFENGNKAILTIILIVSTSLVIYSQINTYSQISQVNNKLSQISTYQIPNDQLAEQIVGLFMLFFVVLCVIWAIPETTFPETHRRAMKAKIYLTEQKKKT